jgi:zinc protease
MIKTLLGVLALASATLLSPTSTAQLKPPAGAVEVASVEGVTEYRLDNGLRVLLMPDATKATTTVNVTYLVGSRHESYGETGMAHLLEHLVFKGTPSITNVFAELGRRGMQFNGTTSFDRTNYFETFSANDETLAWALTMEAERMTQSTFSKADLDTEMTVVRNEFEMGENDPRRVLWKRVQAMAFDWHNYGNTSIGARSDVENVDIDRLRAFYRTYYQPDNAALIVAGRFDAAKTLALIVARFGAIPRPARTLPRLYTHEPVQDGERTVTVRRAGSQKLVAILYRIMRGAHPDSVPLEALSEILTVAPSGRLYRAVVETKKATSVDAWALTLTDPGSVIFWAQVPLADAVEPARDAMLATIADIAKQPITAEEVARVRARSLNSYEQLFNDPERLAVAFSEAIAVGDWRLIYLGRDQWRNLKPADVQRVAIDWLKPANRTVGTFVPDASPDRAPDPLPVDIAALLKDYKGDASVDAGEAFDPTPANLDARTKRYVLPGGLKVALLPKKTRGATVRIALRLHQGDEKSLFGTMPAGSLMGAMLARGTQKRDRQAFDDELDRLRARLGLSASETVTSANGETVRDNVVEVLRLAAEALRTPAFPASEFEKLKREIATGLDASRTEPTAIVQRALARHDNPYPRGDVRYAATLDEQLENLSKVTLDDVRRFHSRFVGASHAEIAVVGDFDEAAVRATIEELFGAWASPSPFTRVPDPYRKTTSAELRFETPDKANATIFGARRTPLRDLDTDYAALLVADQIMGSSSDSRLATRLREKDGLSYSVGSFLQPGQIDNNGTLGMYAIFPPKELARVRAAFAEELTRALDKGFTDDEIASARRALLEERRTNRAQDNVIAASLASQAYLGRTFAESARLDAAIGKVDAAAAHAALRKHLDPSTMAWAFAGDFAKK